MRLEKMVDRRFLGNRSVLGWLRWVKTCKNIVFDRSGVSVGDRLWCLQHGFSVSDFKLFGRENLKKNYKDYLSSRQYCSLHPVNGEYSFWIDDKLTTKYVFSKYNQYLPDYYYQLEKNGILKLCDCPEGYTADFESIVRLLEEKSTLVAKRLWGFGGEGFYKLSYTDGTYYVMDREMDRDQMLTFLQGLHSYLIMERIVNHSAIRNIWPGATNTMRVLYANCGGKLVLMRSFIRFGNAKSKGVDNAHSGGIESIIDEETGRILFTVLMDAKGCPNVITEHPDTGASFDIQVPYWNEIIQTLEKMCRDYPQLRYLGFDVAITEDSFKILEINSLSGLMAAQLRAPLLKDPKTRAVYQYFGLKIK